jgi:magnesium transporter
VVAVDVTAVLPDEGIGDLVVRDVPRAPAGTTIGEVRALLKGRRSATAPAVAVLDGDRLVGLLAIEDLLAADDAASTAELMDPDPPRVRPDVDREVAAWQAVSADEHTVAVEDDDGRFLGLVPPYRLLGVLALEHEEDLARLGGSLHDTSAAKRASRESVGRRLVHRLPWLIVGLAGAAVAAALVGRYEGTLSRNVALAFFLPGIVYMADAVGTQTETLVIRGLSLDVSIREIVRREILTGLLIGVCLAVLFVPVVLAWWDDTEIALAVGLSLLAACSVATGVAMGLPSIFDRFGIDPAFGSGPLATVIQDLLSILIYLAIATAIVD